MKHKSNGFTLVEMAIVLVVIGLLVALAWKGSEMISNARAKNTIEQFKDVASAIELYRDRYHALPGDDPNAGARWPGAVSGNGDGQISGAYNATATNPATTESTMFWFDLRASGFIADGTPPNPQQLSNGVGGRIGVQTGYNLLGLNGLVICANVPAKVAIGIDNNLDDGNPATGMVRAAVGDWTTTLGSTPATSYTEDNNTTYVVCIVANTLGR